MRNLTTQGKTHLVIILVVELLHAQILLHSDVLHFNSITIKVLELELILVDIKVAMLV